MRTLKSLLFSAVLVGIGVWLASVMSAIVFVVQLARQPAPSEERKHEVVQKMARFLERNEAQLLMPRKSKQAEPAANVASAAAIPTNVSRAVSSLSSTTSTSTATTATSAPATGTAEEYIERREIEEDLIVVRRQLGGDVPPVLLGFMLAHRKTEYQVAADAMAKMRSDPARWIPWLQVALRRLESDPSASAERQMLLEVAVGLAKSDKGVDYSRELKEMNRSVKQGLVKAP